jgi:hypothetical protein
MISPVAGMRAFSCMSPEQQGEGLLSSVGGILGKRACSAGAV